MNTNTEHVRTLQHQPTPNTPADNDPAAPVAAMPDQAQDAGPEGPQQTRKPGRPHGPVGLPVPACVQ